MTILEAMKLHGLLNSALPGCLFVSNEKSDRVLWWDGERQLWVVEDEYCCMEVHATPDESEAVRWLLGKENEKEK